MLLPWSHKPPDPTRPETIYTSLTLTERDTLRELATGQRVLEIGAAYGFSAVAMAAAGAFQVVSVDPHTQVTHSLRVMRDNIQYFGVRDRVRMVEDYSWAALPLMADDGVRFDLIFIDGDHRYSEVQRDVRLSLPLLAPGGTLACHDHGEDTCPDVARALDELWDAPPQRKVDTLAIYRPGD